MDTMICNDGWIVTDPEARTAPTQACMCNPTEDRDHECVQECHRPNITILEGLPE